MVQGIIAYFIGGAAAGLVLGGTACFWPALAQGTDCGTVSLIPPVLMLSAGFAPFIFIVGFAARRIAARPLWWISFTTGLLLTPGLAGVAGLAYVLIGFDLESCVGGLKPLCSIGAGLIAEILIFSAAWGIVVMLSRRRTAQI